MKKIWRRLKRNFPIFCKILCVILILLMIDKANGGKYSAPILSKIIPQQPAQTENLPTSFGEDIFSIQAIAETPSQNGETLFVIHSLPTTQTTPLQGVFYTAEFWQNANVSHVLDELKNDVDINARNANGQNILMYAASIVKDPQIIDILISHGAKITARDNEGRTVLMMAAAFNPNPQITAKLINHNVPINVHDKNGWSPLMYAAAKNTNTAVLQILLHYGANIDEQIKEPQTAANKASPAYRVIAAAKSGIKTAENVVKQIYASFKTEGETDYTAIFNQTLDDMGDEILGKYTGMTPLMLAARYNTSPYVITYMLQNGAAIKTTDNKGKTAVDYAKENPFIYKTNIYWQMNDKLYD